MVNKKRFDTITKSLQ